MCKLRVHSLTVTHRESDVQKLNDSKDHLAAFASKYRKMELRLESYEWLEREKDERAA